MVSNRSAGDGAEVLAAVSRADIELRSFIRTQVNDLYKLGNGPLLTAHLETPDPLIKAAHVTENWFQGSVATSPVRPDWRRFEAGNSLRSPGVRFPSSMQAVDSPGGFGDIGPRLSC